MIFGSSENKKLINGVTYVRIGLMNDNYNLVQEGFKQTVLRHDGIFENQDLYSPLEHKYDTFLLTVLIPERKNLVFEFLENIDQLTVNN